VPQNTTNAFAAGALSRTLLGELIALPIPPSWINSRREGKRKERGREREGKEKIVGMGGEGRGRDGKVQGLPPNGWPGW